MASERDSTPQPSKPPRRRHHYTFAHHVLPGVFFADPENFLFVLRKRGTDALTASWNRVGNSFQPEERLPADGLDHEIRERDGYLTVGLITLPVTELSPEAYYVAAVYRPSFDGEAPLVRFLTLERRRPDAPPHPAVCEWTRDQKHHVLGALRDPDREAFFDAVFALSSKPTAR
jgi:hypothetical protein